MTGQIEGDTERLLRTLPLPLAQLLRRAVNAKSSVERHNNAYYLAEATLKLASAARIGVWLERALDTASPLARELEALTLPSAGHWLSLLRDIDADLAKRPDVALLPLGSTFGRLARKAEDWSAVSELATAAAEESAVGADVAKAANRDGILGFFGLVVAYRNAVIGHGAQRRATFYEQFEALWMRALVRLLDSPDLFGGFRLAQTRLQRDSTSATAWQDLTGCAGFPMASSPSAQTGIVAGRLYFVGPGGVIPLHPIALYQEDELGHESVGLLNKTTRRTRRDSNEPVEEVRRADYLDYATGENLKGVDARDALTALLGRLRGKSVSAEEARLVENRTAAAVGDDPVDEVMSSGAALGDFELLEEVGRGGMGIVYRARQRSLQRVVALKVLPPTLAADPTAVQRFQREVSALARCDHPNVIKVFTSSTDGDRHYFAMEYVEGADLAKAGELLSHWRSTGASLRGGHLAAAASVREPSSKGEIALATGEKALAPVLARDAGFHKRLAHLFAGAASGLHHLHERGVIHRDIKPGNLMLTLDGERVVVMDLGLAKLADESRGLTKSDVKVLGTLRYMPPEQLVRKLATIDARVDVYALGATLYELATGKSLLEGETEAELVHQVLAVEPSRADKVDPTVPRALATILAVATAKDPKHRYASAQALADDLEAFAHDRPIAASPPGLGYRMGQFAKHHRAVTGAIAALAVVSLGGASGWWWYNHDHISYCASATTRFGALSCVGRVSASEQRQRAVTYRFTERRGHVVRATLVNGRDLPDSDDEGADGSWELTYRDDGRVEQVLVRSWEGDFLRREVYSDDGTRVEQHDRNDQPQKLKDTDVAVRRFTYDTSGYVTKVTFANVYGSPRPDSRGAFGYAYEVDAQGMTTGETALSAAGTPMPTKDGWVKRAIGRNALGEEIRTSYFDADGKLVTARSGFAERTWQLDTHDGLVEQVVKDAHGQPVWDRETGATRITWQRNEQGDPVEMALFGADGRPTVGTDGWARKRIATDDHGRPSAFDYFGVDGKPTLLNWGVSRVTFKTDAAGHYVERRYFGVDGKPTTRDTGAATWLSTYDTRGNVVEQSYLGIDGRPTRTTLGYARETLTFDDRGNRLSQSFFGTDGGPTLGTLACATLAFRYDERGNMTEKACLGVDGKPAPSSSGWATRRATFDDRGNETDVSFLDVNGAPFGIGGVARETSRYDDRGNLVEHAYYGTDDQPCVSKWGYASFASRFDDRGNLTEDSFFGTDHRPILSKQGTAGLRYRYDDQGNLTERFGVGLDGKPVVNTLGFAIQQRSYDARGNPIEERHLDAERRPMASKNGTAGWRKTYDESGHEKSSVFLGVDWQPKARNDGAVGSRSWIGSDGVVLRRVSHDAQGQPVSGSSDVTKIAWKTVDGKQVVTDDSDLPVTDPARLAVAETRIAAWSMGQRMAALRDGSASTFHGASGALVVTVAPEGQAKRVGLLPGDVILQVDGHAVNRPQDVQQSIDLGQGPTRPVLVLRDGMEAHVEVGPGSLGAELEPE